ncbi:molybdopterin-guanine dinucleotide biosynthesis protein B [uncultured Methanospirillum sp.]|uniref:molybdopterin-guanine dinucleotide biosynthesis protein B n=1 Tax=uncultured Methanospirillum sp. TaxID=262503 RepID=UPI0029C6FAEB|nr:molybdopterin-guanine dinucleotide biosynthesis protein B [uncultured Methanospirillum sp.]
MKVIHIAGWSGSGKTTFIRDLVEALLPFGAVGTIKHIGDHVCDLPAGKDTSLHYNAGASVVAGIDREKTMITCRTISLPAALDQLSDAGVRYAVIEGFKNIPFQKVVIGDLDIPALIRNPKASDVISLIPSFDNYYTSGGLAKEIEEIQGTFTMTTGNAPHELSTDACTHLEDEVRTWDGVHDIRIRVQRPIVHQQARFFIVVQTETAMLGSAVLTRCMTTLGV